jgi:hypothetical protein
MQQVLVGPLQRVPRLRKGLGKGREEKDRRRERRERRKTE